jgi:membrane associated rhomboid family serine protease
MFFPIGDTQVSGGYKPIVSYSLIGINIAVFLMQLGTPGNLLCNYGMIPSNILDGRDYITVLTSLFLHGDIMHLFGNMLFLWIFADNIEAKVGHIPFLSFYIAGGFMASLVHILVSVQPGTNAFTSCMPCLSISPCDAGVFPGFIPTVGASGAISAIMGAYLMMFPSSKIKILFLIFLRSFHLPAFVFLLIWFGQQLLSGVVSLNSINTESVDVAWWAHIGGFVSGILTGIFFRKKV